MPIHQNVLYILWRQDDNGQRFAIATFTSRRAAEIRQEQLARGGHRQIYWIVEEVSVESGV